MNIKIKMVTNAMTIVFFKCVVMCERSKIDSENYEVFWRICLRPIVRSWSRSELPELGSLDRSHIQSKERSDLLWTPNYRFVCPQLASTAKIAEVHHKHNGIHKALRSADKNPEPQTFPKAMKYQKVYFRGQVPMKMAKRQFGT